MTFFEEGSEFNANEEEVVVDVCQCHECGVEFEVGEGEEPSDCPKCGIKFLSEG